MHKPTEATSGGPGVRHFSSFKKWLAPLALIGGLLAFTQDAWALDCVSNVTTGNWNAGGSWTGCGATGPVAGDNVTIEVGTTITVTAPAACATLTFAAPGSAAAVLVHSGTNSLAVSGNVTFNQPTSNNPDNSWNIDAGSATVTGNVTFNTASTTTSRVSQIVITTGTLTIQGNLAFSGTTPATKVINMSGGAGTLNIEGSLTGGAGATLTPGTTSTVRFPGSGTTIDAGSMTFNHVEFDTSDNVIVTGTMDVNGNLTITGANAISGGEIKAAGDVTAADYLMDSSTGTIRLDGTGTQTMQGISGSGRLPNIIVDKAGGTLNLQDTLFVEDWTWVQGAVSAGTSWIVLEGNALSSGSMTFANLAFDTYDNMTVTGTADVNGDFDIWHANMINSGTIAVAGNVSTTNTLAGGGSGTIKFDGAGAQTLQADGVGGTGPVPSILIDKAGGTLTIKDTIRVDGNWTWANGTVDAGTSTVVFIFYAAIAAGGMSFNNVAFASGDGVDITGTMDVNGNLTITNNNGMTGAITVGGNLTSTDTTWSSGATAALTLDGTGTQTITAGGANRFPNGTFTVNKASGTASLATALTLGGADQDLTLTAGTLDMAGFALTVADDLTINGSLRQGAGAIAAESIIVGTTGDWVNNSTGDVTIGAGATGSVTNNGYIRLDGTAAGCGDADAIIVDRGGTGTKNWAGSGTFVMYDVIVNNMTSTPTIIVYSGSGGAGANWSFNGTCPATKTWDGGGANNNWSTVANWTGDVAPTSSDTAIFDGTSTKNCAIAADPNVGGIDINGGYTGTITQNPTVAVTIGTSGYDQAAGTFSGGDSTIAINDGPFTLSGGAFTSTSGQLSFITSSTRNFTISGGTFTHNSGTVAVSNGNATFNTGSAIFNNVTFNTNGYITITGTMDVNGDLTNTDTDFISGGTIAVAGNVTATDDIVTSPHDAIILFDGAGPQTLDAGGGSGFLPRVSIDKSGGSTLTIQDTIWVKGHWTYTAGTVDAGTSTVVFGEASKTITSAGMSFNNVTINSDGDVTISGTGTMDVNGNLVITASSDLIDGTITVAGNATTTDTTMGSSSTTAITLDGTGTQNITAGGSNRFPNGTFTINKASGTASLATALTLDGSSQDLTLTAGTLDLAGFGLTVNDVLTINGALTQGAGTLSAGTYTIGATGSWTNSSTGDVTVGAGGVANSGLITLNGGGPGCGTDEIIISSSSPPTARNWTGGGTFDITDVDVRNQTSTPLITAYHSTNTSAGANWSFNATCPGGRVPKPSGSVGAPNIY